MCVSLAFSGVFLFWWESMRFSNFVSSRLFLPVAVLLVRKLTFSVTYSYMFLIGGKELLELIKADNSFQSILL